MTTVSFLWGLIRVTQYAFFEAQRTCPHCSQGFVSLSGTSYSMNDQRFYRRQDRDTYFCSEQCRDGYWRSRDASEEASAQYRAKWS